MLEITTPFIYNLEGICTYSGRLILLRVGVPPLARHLLPVSCFQTAPPGADHQ